jgi:hypothetical protein
MPNVIKLLRFRSDEKMHVYQILAKLSFLIGVPEEKKNLFGTKIEIPCNQFDYGVFEF